MKQRIMALTISLLLAGAAAGWTQPTIYLVRHSEKLAGWFEAAELDAYQPLSAEGIETAKQVAARFQPGEVAVVYSSQTTRTLHTALLIAQQTGAPVQVAKACADTAVIASFLLDLSRRFRPAQTVVLVSHSNVIPHFLIKAGLAKECWPELGVLSTFFDPEPRIEGYDYFWKIAGGRARAGGCGSFERVKFR